MLCDYINGYITTVVGLMLGTKELVKHVNGHVHIEFDSIVLNGFLVPGLLVQ